MTVSLAKAAQDKGFRLLDAPVSGGEAGAKNAALSIMVGGAEADFEEARPVLDAVGKTVVHVGGNGAGQTVKAANQLIVAANIQAPRRSRRLPRGLRRGPRPGPRRPRRRSGGLQGARPEAENMATKSFEPGFRIDLHHKDMGIVTSAAREAGVVVPLGGLVAQLMASARANGDGGLDHSGSAPRRGATLRPALRLSRTDPTTRHTQPLGTPRPSRDSRPGAPPWHA